MYLRAVPTVKMGENLSMNAIEYLENLSKTSDDEADYRETADPNEQMERRSEEMSPVIFSKSKWSSP